MLLYGKTLLCINIAFIVRVYTNLLIFVILIIIFFFFFNNRFAKL